MRRKEFEIRDGQLIDEVLRSAQIGYLSFNGPDGWPRVTPLNFIFDGRILWHGAIAGERSECLKKDPRATFVAVSVELYLPSHLISEENATGASVAFKSVSALAISRSRSSLAMVASNSPCLTSRPITAFLAIRSGR